MAAVARAPAPEAPSRREEEPRLDLWRRDFLSAADLTAEELAAVLDRAAELKSAIRPAAVQPLAGRTIALLFQKPSLRTRVSFELAVRRLGGDPMHLGREAYFAVRRCAVPVICAVNGATVGAGVALAAPKPVSDPVQKALHDRYPDAKVQVERTREVHR